MVSSKIGPLNDASPITISGILRRTPGPSDRRGRDSTSRSAGTAKDSGVWTVASRSPNRELRSNGLDRRAAGCVNYHTAVLPPRRPPILMMGNRRRSWAYGVAAAVALVVAAECTGSSPGPSSNGPPASSADPTRLTGIHKIQHVIIVMQENRSFDNYFGTYPGADGIPMADGRPKVCIPDVSLGHCVPPFHDKALVNLGGPHSNRAADKDINDGKMNGFLNVLAGLPICDPLLNIPNCRPPPEKGPPDVVGWHDAREIPNYWRYAQRFALQDHMFEGVRSWSLPAHLDMVSGWSADCASHTDPMSCHTELGNPRGWPDLAPINQANEKVGYAWTDLTYLMYRAGVDWAYYVTPGIEPDCVTGSMTCAPEEQSPF